MCENEFADDDAPRTKCFSIDGGYNIPDIVENFFQKQQNFELACHHVQNAPPARCGRHQTRILDLGSSLCQTRMSRQAILQEGFRPLLHAMRRICCQRVCPLELVVSLPTSDASWAVLQMPAGNPLTRLPDLPTRLPRIHPRGQHPLSWDWDGRSDQWFVVGIYACPTTRIEKRPGPWCGVYTII